MIDFNALAACAATVKVGGQDVKIRPPSLAFERELARIGEARDAGDPTEQLIAFRQMTAKMMADMVVTDDPVPAEAWERILKIPDENQPDAKGMRELVNVVLKMCGLDLKGEDQGEAPRDMVDEAAAGVGKRSTTSRSPRAGRSRSS